MSLLIPSLIALLVGVALLARGLRGRRVGDEPHCRCGYLLHGLESEVCPECGEALTPARIRYGTRRRIRWQIIAASLCLAFALTGLSLHLAGVAQRIDWYRLAPMSWLANAAESGNRDALAEIDRRLGAPKINASDFRAAVETGLRVQENRPPAADLQAWLNLLSKLESKACLSPQQRDQFFSNIVELSLVARSRLRQGDPLAYRIDMLVRAPNTGLFARRLEFTGAKLGADGPVWLGHGMTESLNSAVPLGDRQSSSSSVGTTRVSPGQTALAVSFVLSLKAVGTSASSGTPLWSKAQTLTAPVTILPPDAPDPIARHTDEQIGRAWRGALEVNNITSEPGDASIAPRADMGVRAKPPIPRSAAFDIWLEVAGRKERLANLSIRAPLAFAATYFVGGRTSLPLADGPVRVILRGSREATLAQPDIDDYFDGEIDLGEFRLAPDFADPRRWTFDQNRIR